MCRGRLEANAEQWNELLVSLQELIEWASQREEEIERQQPVGGDVFSVRQQHLEHQVRGLGYRWGGVRAGQARGPHSGGQWALQVKRVLSSHRPQWGTHQHSGYCNKEAEQVRSADLDMLELGLEGFRG